MNQQSINLEIQSLDRQKQAVLGDIASYAGTLKLADIATFLMIFVFLVGFYISDPFHLASFIADKFGNNGLIELLVYALLLGMALIMAITISRLKRAHYHHKAKYRFGGSVWKVAAVIMAFTVFAEMYNATGNQQHSQFAKAENSKAFTALAGQKVEINTGSASAANLPYLQGQLAEAERYVQGCKKTCAQWQAKADKLRAQIAGIEAGQQQAAATAQSAAAGAANALAANLQKLKEDYLHPMIKMLMSLGIPASVAMQLIAGFVAIAFERMHLSASENLRDCYARLDDIEAQLLNRQKALAVLDDTPIQAQPLNTPRNPIGFSIPQVATATLSEPLRFKYQTEEREIYKTPDTSKQGFVGFVNPNHQTTSKQPSPARAEAQSQALPIIKQPANKNHPQPVALGSAEEQLPIPHFANFKARRDVFASPALSDSEQTALPVPNSQKPHSDAGSDGSKLPQIDSNEFALLRDTVLHKRFDAAFLDVATGTIGCSQRAMMKAHQLGGETTKWIMTILEAWEVVTEPNTNQQGKRQLINALSLAQAQSKLDSVKTSILGA